MALSKHSMKALKMGKAPLSPVLAASTYAQSLKAGSSSSIQPSDCERFLAGHPHTQENSRHAYMTNQPLTDHEPENQKSLISSLYIHDKIVPYDTVPLLQRND